MLIDKDLSVSIDRFLASEEAPIYNEAIVTDGIPVGKLNFDELNVILDVMKGIPFKERCYCND